MAHFVPLFDDVFDFLALGVVSALIVWWIWQKLRLRKAADWPTTEATIESGAIEVVARNRYTTVELPVFSFSYSVGTEYFGGRFALLPYITDPGDSIIQRMIGRKLRVRYDPKHRDVWFIPDELIEGCKVEQKVGPHLFAPRS